MRKIFGIKTQGRMVTDNPAKYIEYIRTIYGSIGFNEELDLIECWKLTGMLPIPGRLTPFLECAAENSLDTVGFM